MLITRRLGALLTTAALAGAAAIAPTASAATGDDAAVVNAWYADFLDRPGYGNYGALYWEERLKTQSPADVLWALAHTQESNGKQVRAYYQAYLGRDPDAGANFWVKGTTAQRFPLEWVEQNVLASPEYAGIQGSETNIVYAWYDDVLGIEALPDQARPTDAEVSYWGGRIRAIGRLGALREMWYAPESVRTRIAVTYYAELDREPSAAEVSYWYPKEVESDINVAVLIAATPEYRSLAS